MDTGQQSANKSHKAYKPINELKELTYHQKRFLLVDEMNSLKMPPIAKDIAIVC